MHCALKPFFAAVAIAVVMCACRKDERERLFDLVYPNIPFDLPAGLPSGLVPRALVQDGFSSNLRFYLNTYQTDTSAIAGIFPFSASIRALDGSNLNFFQEISVRICPQGTASCTQADEVFYIDNLQQSRIGSQIRLLPTLINAKRHFTKERFKLEVWFFLQFPSPRAIPCRLDMTFEAVR